MTRRPFVPRTYQVQAVDWILNTPRCALWAGMGMGKSVSVLTALNTLTLVESRPTLVLAPRRVAVSVWPEEVAKWDHLSELDVSPVVGTEKERIAALKWDVPIYSCNFDVLPWLCDYLGARWPFATVIADEATRLKSFRLRQGGKRAHALGRLAHTKIKRFIALTGTPSPNGLLDLWGQMWFLDRGQRLGRTMGAYKQRWFRPSFDGYGVEPLPHAMGEIKERLKDICLSIDPKDHFDLREPIVNNIYVDMPPKARALYRAMERRMYAEIEGHGVEAFNAAARTIKCLQLANGAAYVGEGNTERKTTHDAKLEALESIVSEAAGMPVLVVYNFRSDLARLRAAFPLARSLDTDPATLAEWNLGKIPILLAHPASAGHGLNLQDGGNIIAFFGLNWNLEEHQQVIERIGPVRQMQAGHDRPVFVYRIVARDTVDELVLDRLESKRSAQDILLGAMKARSS